MVKCDLPQPDPPAPSTVSSCLSACFQHSKIVCDDSNPDCQNNKCCMSDDICSSECGVCRSSLKRANTYSSSAAEKQPELAVTCLASSKEDASTPSFTLCGAICRAQTFTAMTVDREHFDSHSLQAGLDFENVILIQEKRAVFEEKKKHSYNVS